MLKKVLVTGADGFIGSHLVEYLITAGYEVRAMVWYNSFNSCGWLGHNNPDILKQVEVVPGDIRDPFWVLRATEGIDIIFHLAALIAIPYSYDAPESYIATNVNGTLNILEGARKHGVARVLIASSSEVYGTARYVPIDEAHPLQGQSPYSATKIAAEKMAEAYFKSFELPVVIVRPFNTFGPRQSVRAVIPAIITQLCADTDEIKLGALTPTRDYVYVGDTVAAFEAIARAAGVEGKEINIASGVETSIGDLAQSIIQQINPEARIVQDETRMRPDNSEVQRLLGDNSKLKALTDWQSRWDLERGIEQTIEWFQQPENQQFYQNIRYTV